MEMGSGAINKSKWLSNGCMLAAGDSRLQHVGTDPRKSLQYCRSPNKFMFICRYNLYNAEHAGPSTAHRNSVFDEFCVYDESHVVILWMLKVAK